jgi:4-hydroxy-3-methylbut-2-enyl diphosphate reductase IspH
MRILRTAHFGMCFGVRDAIAVAKWVDFRNEDVSLNVVSLWYP